MASYSDYQILQALCRQRFGAFVEKAFNIVEPGIAFERNWHVDCIAEHLQALHEDKLGKSRLCINIPPRSLKSFIASVAFPAWVIGNDPTKKFICTSHKFPLAKTMAQKARILIESDWYCETFSKTRIDDRQNEKHNFWTTERGFYYSSAIASITGTGGDYVILDDVINPQEAVSDTVRVDTNETISSTIPTRFNDWRKGKWLMIMQRLHEDDPTGHFALKDERWHVLKLPGENKTEKTITYSIGENTWELPPGELLFPQRLTRKVLDELREDLGDYNYAGQILQEPVPIGGGLLKPEWCQFYKDGGIKPHEMNVVILVDPAGGDDRDKKKKSKLSDWTAMMVVGLAPDGNYYLLDAVRDRLNPDERLDTLFTLHRKWNGLCRKPPKVGYERYSMQSDIFQLEKKKQLEAYNFPVVELGGNMSKTQRVMRMEPDLRRGRWYFPQTLLYIDMEGRKWDLVKEIMYAEMATFPRSKYDDMCFVAGTLIATSKGEVPIQNIQVGDLVLTSDGYRRVYNAGRTGKMPVVSKVGLRGTANHPVYTIDKSYIPLDSISSDNEILRNDICSWIKIALLKSLSSMVSPTDSWEQSDIILRNTKVTLTGGALRACMWQYGNLMRAGQYLKAITFTTKIATHLTIALRIWSAYQLVNTAVCLKRWTWFVLGKILRQSGHLPLHGTEAKRVESGIGNTLKTALARYLYQGHMIASSVVNLLFPQSRELCAIALAPAGIKAEKRTGIINQFAFSFVRNVRNHLKCEDQKQNIAASHARIEDVYNLSVEGAHCYFANGVLVHNCDALSRVYDEQLFLTFPKLRTTMAQKAYSARESAEPDNWENW